MEFLNYFDVRSEEIENKDVRNYLKKLYQEISAPKGKVSSWQILSHPDEGMKRISAIYDVEGMKNLK